MTVEINLLERRTGHGVAALAPNLLEVEGCGFVTAAKIVGEVAGFLSSRFDEGRAVVIEKIFGVLIAAIAVQLVLNGLGSAHL